MRAPVHCPRLYSTSSLTTTLPNTSSGYPARSLPRVSEPSWCYLTCFQSHWPVLWLPSMPHSVTTPSTGYPTHWRCSWPVHGFSSMPPKTPAHPQVTQYVSAVSGPSSCYPAHPGVLGPSLVYPTLFQSLCPNLWLPSTPLQALGHPLAIQHTPCITIPPTSYPIHSQFYWPITAYPVPSTPPKPLASSRATQHVPRVSGPSWGYPLHSQCHYPAH